MLVEDELSLRKAMREALQLLGYVVLEAQDATQALEAVRHFEGPIHLMISDVVMPGMSGLDLAQESVRLRPGIKVILMSGTKQLGADRWPQSPVRPVDFLQKPFRLKNLAQKARQVLDGP